MTNNCNIPLQNRFLFSARRIDNNEWVEGFIYQIADNLNPFIMIPNSNGEIHEIDPITLRFSISYKDYNNKTIFDKDVLEFTSHSGKKRRYLVQWIDEGQEFQAIPFVEGDDIYDHGYYFANLTREISWGNFIVMLQDCYGHYRKIEVIGNAIDNPDLIPVSDDFFAEEITEESCDKNIYDFNFKNK